MRHLECTCGRKLRVSRTRRCEQRPGAGPAAGVSVVTSPGGVTALVMAPPVRSGGRAPWPGDSDVTSPRGVTASSVRSGAGPRGPVLRKSGVTSPDYVGIGRSRPTRGHVPESRRSRCAAQASDLVTATTASFQRWSRQSRRRSRRSRRRSRRSRRRSRRRRPRPRDTAITGSCATQGRVRVTAATAVTALVTAAPSAG